eukprot:227338_1
MQNLKTIQEEMRIDYANSIQSPSIHQFQPSNEDLSSIFFPDPMAEEKSKQLSWKYYYRKKITDKQNNSCVGVKFISLNEASVRWCIFDLTHACILLVSCIVIYIGHGEQLDFFPLRFYNDYLQLSEYEIVLFLIFIISWIISDMFLYLGVLYGNQCLIALKFISICIINFVCIEGYGLMEICLTIRDNKTFQTFFMLLFVLYLLFNMVTVLWIASVTGDLIHWIRHYKNGIYKDNMSELHRMNITNNIYKIVNMDKEPIL